MSCQLWVYKNEVSGWETNAILASEDGQRWIALDGRVSSWSRIR